MKKLIFIILSTFCIIAVYAKRPCTILNSAFQFCVNEHIHNASDSINGTRYDVWQIPMDSGHYVTLTPDEFISVFKDDVFGIIHENDVDLSTPLKKKLFEESRLYAKYDSAFQIVKGLVYNHTIHFWDKSTLHPRKSAFTNYDLEKGGFRFAYNPPFSTVIPDEFVASFIRDNKTFFVPIKNLKVASMIEDSYGKNDDFVLCYLIRHHSGEPPLGYTLNMSTGSSSYYTSDPSFYFELTDIRLTHSNTQQLVWSLKDGDLSEYFEYKSSKKTK